MEYLGAWGTLIHEKNLKSKISCQTPFKQFKPPFKLSYLAMQTVHILQSSVKERSYLELSSLVKLMRQYAIMHSP
jgi:hypothetical protein